MTLSAVNALIKPVGDSYSKYNGYTIYFRGYLCSADSTRLLGVAIAAGDNANYACPAYLGAKTREFKRGAAYLEGPDEVSRLPDLWDSNVNWVGLRDYAMNELLGFIDDLQIAKQESEEPENGKPTSNTETVQGNQSESERTVQSVSDPGGSTAEAIGESNSSSGSTSA